MHQNWSLMTFSNLILVQFFSNKWYCNLQEISRFFNAFSVDLAGSMLYFWSFLVITAFIFDFFIKAHLLFLKLICYFSTRNVPKMTNKISRQKKTLSFSAFPSTEKISTVSKFKHRAQMFMQRLYLPFYSELCF